MPDNSKKPLSPIQQTFPEFSMHKPELHNNEFDADIKLKDEAFGECSNTVLALKKFSFFKYLFRFLYGASISSGVPIHRMNMYSLTRYHGKPQNLLLRRLNKC